MPGPVSPSPLEEGAWEVMPSVLLSPRRLWSSFPPSTEGRRLLLPQPLPHHPSSVWSGSSTAGGMQPRSLCPEGAQKHRHTPFPGSAWGGSNKVKPDATHGSPRTRTTSPAHQGHCPFSFIKSVPQERQEEKCLRPLT